MKKIYFLLLLVTSLAFAQPPIGTPVDFSLCDYNNDGVEAVDLTMNTPAILNGLNPGLYTLNYYNSQADAISDMNPIVNSTTHIAHDAEVVYARVHENADTSNFSTASFMIHLSSMPTAMITGNMTICSGTSTALTIFGTPNAIVEYTIDSGSIQTVMLNNSGSAVLMTPPLTTTTVYSLVSVATTDAMGCMQPLFGTAVITVMAIPTASATGTSPVCVGEPGTVTFTGTPNAVVTYTVNAGSPQTIALNSSGVAVLTTPPFTVAGQFAVFNLVSVQTTGTLECMQSLSGGPLLSVGPPISGSMNIPIAQACEGTPFEVTFIGSGGQAPYVFTYAIDGGAQQTVASASTSSWITTMLTNIPPGVHTLSLVSVQSMAGSNCIGFPSAVATITVYASPNPGTPADLYVLDDPFDGVANFDLTANNAALINGVPNISVNYYNTQNDAEQATLSITNTTSYSAGSGQKVWARVQNTASPNCYAVKSFRLYATDPNAPNDFINIPDPAFKSALITIGVDTNNDGQIQYAEATVPTQLAFASLGITDLTGINFFTNLTSANFNSNQIAGGIDISNLVNLTSFECNGNQVTGITLPVSANLTQLFCANNQLTALDLSGTTGLQTLYCVNNQISSLTFTPSLKTVSCGQNSLTSLNLNSLVNLEYFTCDENNGMTSFTANGLTNLLTLSCGNNIALLSVDVSGCSSLNNLSTNGNDAMTSLNISGCTGLDYLSCTNSQLTTLDASNLPTLAEIRCNNNLLTSLNVSGCPALKNLYCNNNQLVSLDVSGTSVLQLLLANNNQLTSLAVTNKPQLMSFSCNANPTLTSLDLSGCSALPGLYLTGLGQLASLNVSGCTGMMGLDCPQNALTTLNVSGLNALQSINCQNNDLTTLNLTGCANLRHLTCYANNLTALDFSDTPLMINLNCAENNLATLYLSNLTKLQNLNCAANQLTLLDVTNSSLLQQLNCSVNNLVSLFVKNGATETVSLQLNPNLVYICADEVQIPVLSTLAGPTVQVNSYCSFTLGGNYNTITGAVTFDGDNNGCDAGDVPHPFIKVTINDGSSAGATFTDAASNFSFYTGIGDYTLAAEFENQTLFNITPVNPVVSFTDTNNNTATQNFCITPNGIHPDVEVVIAPLIAARPGFPAVYKIVYKNKGNQIVSGSVNLAFDDAVLNFVSASTAPNAQSTGSLTWNYSNLQPFENRSITLTLQVNTPTDTPPVNIGHVLPFTVTINPIAGDDTPADNTFQINQTVVGAYDPNDITCLEGAVVSPAAIGNYLHYIINFENTGNFAAENIVVRDIIDASQYDINSLQILNSSAAVTARVKNNVVEFIFPQINLDSGGHGNILLKMKSKNTLADGDMVSKAADIFFDYNAPVTTDPAETIFQSLSNPDFPTDHSVTIYPNPTKNNIHISSQFTVKSIQLYDVQGRLLLTKIVNENQTELDMSTQTTGIYFVKTTTDKGVKVDKIVKE